MPVAYALDAPERALVRAVNRERAAHGLPPVRTTRRLSRGATRHSIDQLRTDRMSHDSSDGTPFNSRIGRAGSFRRAGEVLAWLPGGARAGARSTVAMWMASPPHRAELLTRSFRRVGVGRERGALGGRRGIVVTLDLTSRR